MTRLICIAALIAAACGDDDAPPDGGGVDGSIADAGGADASACPRTPGPPDGLRYAVVSHPYDADGNEVGVYEVLELSATGELSRPGTAFSMGPATLGSIAFTPDGAVGVAPQKDGSLGVFTLDGDGVPTVVHASYTGMFYADAVVASSDGAHMFVLDPNWRKNGGGIYRIALGCDGSIVDEQLVAPAKSSGAIARIGVDGDEFVLWADDVLDSTAGDDAHRIALSGSPSLSGSADGFGDDEAIVSSAAVTVDGRFSLAGDTSQFSGVDNRVAIVELTGAGLEAVQVLTPIEDPIAIATSPFGDAAIVASGFGDAVFVLDYEPGGDPPWAVRGEMTYDGAPPALPGKAVSIDRGSLRGLVLLAENVGVRRIQLGAGATVTDLGEFSFGSGLDQITGVIGVQP